jgi:hypothetical protein
MQSDHTPIKPFLKWAGGKRQLLAAIYHQIAQIPDLMTTDFGAENSQFPIPNSQFPIPNSQFPIPNSQFPIPNSQFPIPALY